MRLWKSLSLMIAGIVIVGLLAACGTTAAPTPTQAAAAEGAALVPAPVTAPVVAVPVQAPAETAPASTAPALKPVLGGIWDYGGGTPEGHDPYPLAQSWGNDWTVYNSLVQVKFPYDPVKGIQYEPYLATEYAASEDGTKWRFKLRQGVTWHDGEVFNADDVVATFRRHMEPDFLVGTDTRTARDVFVGIKKIDDYTVEFDTGKPDITAFAYLSSHYMVQVPEHLIRGEDPTSSNVEKRWKRIGILPGQSGTYAIGTGPFSVKDWKLDDHLLLLKNPNYYKFDEEGRRLPYLDGVRHNHIVDKLRNLAWFVAGGGEFNMGGRCCGMTTRDALALCKQTRDAGCWTLLSPHGFGHIVVNSQSTPIFQDPKVNAAHRYGHDVEVVMNSAFSGGSGWLWVDREYWPDGTLSQKEQYELLPWSNQARRAEFDAKAKQLMADAGYPNGVDLPYPFFAASGTGGLCFGSFLDQQSRHMDEIYSIGLRTHLECRAGVDVVAEMKAGRWAINNNYPSINLITPATGIIQGGTKTSGIVARLPWAWKGDDVADAKYRVIQKTLDTTKQNELFKDYERFMADPAFTNFMGYYAKVFFSVRSCAHNFNIGGAWGTHRYALERVWLTDACREASK